MTSLKGFLYKHRKKAAAIALLLTFYAVLYVIFRGNKITREEVEAFLQPLGGWGIVAAFCVQVLTSLTPLPDAPLAFVTMILYGPYVGSLAIMGGMLTATTINYHIAHRLGKKYILRRFPQTDAYLQKYGERATIESLVLLRFFSFVTFDLVSYIAALSGVPFWKFFISSVIGLIPMVVSHALVSQGLFTDNPVDIVISWSIPAAVTLTAAYLARKTRDARNSNGNK